MEPLRHLRSAVLPGSLAVLAGISVAAHIVPAYASPVMAQSAPPVRGTMALEGTIKKVYAAANKVVVATIDGVEHVYTFTKDLLVHGGKGSGVDALRGLREGSTVVVHYVVERTRDSAQEIDEIGPEGLSTTEGMVTRIDRGRKQITIRFDNGATETLRLTERAAADAGSNIDAARGGGVGAEPSAPQTAGTRVIVYYSNERGQKVAHYFRKVSATR